MKSRIYVEGSLLLHYSLISFYAHQTMFIVEKVVVHDYKAYPPVPVKQ